MRNFPDVIVRTDQIFNQLAAGDAAVIEGAAESDDLIYSSVIIITIGGIGEIVKCESEISAFYSFRCVIVGQDFVVDSIDRLRNPIKAGVVGESTGPCR